VDCDEAKPWSVPYCCFIAIVAGDVLLSVVWLVILLFYRLENDIHAVFWQFGVP